MTTEEKVRAVLQVLSIVISLAATYFSLKADRDARKAIRIIQRSDADQARLMHENDELRRMDVRRRSGSSSLQA